MKTNELILKFEDKEEEYNFADKINKIEDGKLVKILGRENIKNSNSTLIIKSMNLPISDVIQFKINVSEVGSFLFNFEKSKMNDQIREEILSKITKLHDDVEPTKETQINKIKNLISIVSEYEEIYCSYLPNGKFKLSFDELSEALKDIEFSFPILALENKEKGIFDVEGSKLGFRKFTIDYLFTSIFSILMSFGVMTGIFQIFNKQSIAAFLLVLAFVFFGVLTYSIYSVIYKQNKEVNKKLKYFLLIYTTVGIAVGIIIAWIVCKFALKVEVEGLSLTTVALISGGASLALSIASIYTPKLINLIVKKI
ncbi:MAG: hypothetical protein KBS97_02350 [Firmicutes bacterium]|nr:hypothetical protein [Candidatus Fiminaster equi]